MKLYPTSGANSSRAAQRARPASSSRISWRSRISMAAVVVRSTPRRPTGTLLPAAQPKDPEPRLPSGGGPPSGSGARVATESGDGKEHRSGEGKKHLPQAAVRESGLLAKLVQGAGPEQ